MFISLFVIIVGSQGSGQAFSYIGDVNKGISSTESIFNYLETDFKIYGSNTDNNNAELTSEDDINVVFKNVQFA